MPIILCIETATKLCSVALSRDGTVLASRDLESDQYVHAEKVNVFIDAVITEAGSHLKELDAVAVGIGPGSYTGLRIGLSAAKGLCYALDIPIIGISTLRTLHDAAPAQQPNVSVDAWPMIDARRMEVFTQRFGVNGQGIDAPAPLVLDGDWASSHAPALVFGDGADKAGELWLREGITFIPGIRPYASAMVQEAERRFAQAAFDDVAYLAPAYGKAANVTQPKKKSAG
jgi:tRNA threonylcarbamoyladenosine biosynthesis protein TsaB